MVGTGVPRSTEGARHRLTRTPTLGGGRDLDGPASGALPALARPDLRRHRRPASGRRDAPQCGARRPGRPRDPVRRAARDGQDVARPDPGQGAQLHRPPRRRRLRRLSVVRLHPRGDDPRPDRDRRRQQSRHRRRSKPARAAALSAGPAAQEGLHPRRGAPDHPGRLERAAQVARGAAAVRDLHVRLDRALGLPAGDPVAPPALRRPAPDHPRDRGQARAGSSPPTDGSPIPAPST